MSRQYFRELLEPINLASEAAIAGTSEADLLGTGTAGHVTQIAANTVRAGQAFALSAGGVMTTAASTPGTLTITPRWGTTTGGTTLGASAASATLGTSQTAVPWYLEANLLIRSIGASGAAVLTGSLSVPSGVLAAAVVFGGTVATINTTAAAGLWLGVTLGSASDGMTAEYVLFEELN